MEDDIEAAEAVTHTKITNIMRSGTRKTKTVLVPLVPLVKEEKPPRVPIDPHGIQNNYEMPDPSEANPPPKTNKVDAVISINEIYIFLMWNSTKTQRDHVQEFVDCINDLLHATLS